MKLRIFEQSVRFRLTADDLGKLVRLENLTSHLLINPQSSWAYALELGPHQEPQVSAYGTSFKVELPREEFLKWNQSSDIEWRYAQVEPELEIWIEKDLKPHRD